MGKSGHWVPTRVARRVVPLLFPAIFTTALSIALLANATFPSPANAVPLSPGDTVPLSGTTVAARPELAGVVLQDVIRPFSIDFGDGTFTTGQVQDRVVRETATGTLDLYYRIFNDAGSAGFVGQIVRGFFDGFATDVDFRIDGLGTVGPDSAFRSLAGSLGGDQVFFSFLADRIDPGEESRFFFVRTDATNFNEGGGTLINSVNARGISQSVNFPTFQPTPVPEPGTLLLLASGLAGVGGLAWKRHRRQ